MSDRWIRRRGIRRVGALAVAVLALSACGEPKERSLCTVFARYLESRAKITAIDPESTTAQDAEELVAEHQKAVAALTQVTDGRYASVVTALDEALRGLSNELASVDDEADFTTWVPLVQDSLDAVRDASAQLENTIGASCVDESSETTVEPTPTT